MEWRQSLILSAVYALFLILGGVMFMYLEYEVEEYVDVKELREWTRLKELAIHNYGPEDELLALVMWLPKNCTTVSNATINELIRPGSREKTVYEVEELCPHLRAEEVIVAYHYPLNFIEALHFSMTVTTTIGYGLYSPYGVSGRIMCMIYALIGIPLTGILLAWTSEFFGEQLFKMFKSKLNQEEQQSKKIIAAATFIYIAIGFVVFIFLPAVIFMVIEEWTYLSAVYFAFITLTTIGFGDLVTGTEMEGVYLYIYHVGVILWIMVGLGYWVMVANFITKALKSKRLQSSMLRSAEEMKKLMHQMGIKNQDPTFLRQHSKATVNFMLQLSNIIAVQGGVDGLDAGGSESPESPGTASTTTPSSSAPYSPVSSPMGIPGISALFGPAMKGGHPIGSLIGPLGLNKYLLSPKPKKSPDGCSDDGIEEKTEIGDTVNFKELQEVIADEPELKTCEDTDKQMTPSQHEGKTPTYTTYDNPSYINEGSGTSTTTLGSEEGPV